jgi:hypothetical protein
MQREFFSADSERRSEVLSQHHRCAFCRRSVKRSIQQESFCPKIRHKYVDTDFENRKDVLQQHHRAHFAAGDKTGWYRVKVVPRLAGC